ncbi:hypothetical protein [Hymenobacter pini]|uniref:hypothetical protein n=1 Tax=Hymenobacter pini TaxID=2880879 RepID=UPI001CF33D82|nr:hypothetical protein [Hymenobacter pini]MCA8832924.1 hypothetical protein [Hymenobacter pini]
MKMLLLLLVVSLQLLLRPVQWLTTGSWPEPGQATTDLRAGLAVAPDATLKGCYQVRLPTRHGALQVSVLDAQNRPMQPAQLVAPATAYLTLDARQWPAGHYQIQLRSASGLISTSLHVH